MKGGYFADQTLGPLMCLQGTETHLSLSSRKMLFSTRRSGSTSACNPRHTHVLRMLHQFRGRGHNMDSIMGPEPPEACFSSGGSGTGRKFFRAAVARQGKNLSGRSIASGPVTYEGGLSTLSHGVSRAAGQGPRPRAKNGHSFKVDPSGIVDAFIGSGKNIRKETKATPLIRGRAL